MRRQLHRRPETVAIVSALLAAGLLMSLPSSAAGETLTDPEPDMRLARVDYGTAGDVTDDCFYLHSGPNDTIAVDDVRIVVGSGCAGKTLGSLVHPNDTTEAGQAASVTPYVPAYYDVNNNAVFDLGDALLVGNNANNATLVQSSSNTEWWIRLTPSSGKAAGTLIFAGDPDFVTFGAGQLTSGSEAAFVDFNGDGAFGPGDWLFLTAHAIQTGDTVPIASVRIVRQPGEFGTQEGAGGTTATGTGTTPPVTTGPPPNSSTPVPLPPPLLSIERPVEGETVRHVVEIAGQVQVDGGQAVNVFVNILGPNGWVSRQDFVVGSGEWSVLWDTRNGADGEHRIHATACYAQAFGFCSFTPDVSVRVRNVEVQVDHGIVGCAAHAGPVVLADLCNGITTFAHPVHEHLASATFVLNWTGLTPLPIHDLRLTVQIGGRTFVAEGSSLLELAVNDLDLAEDGLATMEVSVGAAGLGPDVALDEEFTLTSVWSYR